MSDFSIFSLFTAGLACLIPLTSAYTQPVGAEPEGNPIYTPGLHDIVPAGEPYTITWNPTTDGTVTLVLLKGPSTNAQPQYPIIENYPNTGNFIWVPKDNLEDSNGDTGYGIQLIVDATGQYQYTTQFGISNDKKSSGPGHYGGDWSSTATPSSSSSSSSSKKVISSGYAAPTGGWHGGNGSHPHPTGWAPHNTTKIQPTGYASSFSSFAPVPSSSSYAPIASTPAPPSPTHTGGASALAASMAGLVLAAGAAVLAL